MTHPGWGNDWSAVALPDRPPARSSELDHREAALRRARRSRAIRFTVLGVAGLVAVVAAVGIWVALGSFTARDELQASATAVDTLRTRVSSGDGQDVDAVVADLQEHASAAREATSGPQWSLVGVLPWVGPNTRALQTVTAVVDDLATHALPSLVEATQVLDPSTLAPVDGRIDPELLRDVAPQVVNADASVAAASARLRRVDTSDLLRVVAEPVEQLRDQVAGVAMTTATASRAVQLLPAMLGVDGPRQFLVLVQNNAEQRATGGIPGSVLLVRTDDGRISIIDQRAGNHLGGLSEPVIPLTAEERSLFGDNLGQTMLDVTFTPDFPRSAQLATALWSRSVGPTQLDGVLSVDPGTLALVLGVLGPVDLADGSELTADNAEQRLMNQVYLDSDDNGVQDEFFGSATHAVFDAVMTGDANPAKLVDAFAQAAREGRMLAWSADPEQQALLSGTVLSGELAGRQGASPVVGVFLEDSGGAKIGYYLEPTITLQQASCRPDGSQELTLDVTLHSTAPADAAELPGYLVGAPLGILPPGEIWTNVLVYAPSGGWIASHTASDGVPGLSSQAHDGLAVAGRTVILKPGDSTKLTFELVTGPDLVGPPVLRTTPTALGPGPVARGGRCGDSSLS